jgi:hypothetical protein
MNNFRVHDSDGRIIIYFRVSKKRYGDELHIDYSYDNTTWVDIGSFTQNKLYRDYLQFLVEKIDEINHPAINALFRDSKIDNIIGND